MGDMYLKLIVANQKEPQRHKEVTFLVDTGATWAWMPNEIAKAIGIEPAGTTPVELADGSTREFPYGFCLFTYDGQTVSGNVVIGPSESEPLVGNHTLQDFRLIVDLERGEITRRRGLRAK